MIELFCCVAVLWFLYYLINHAEMFDRLRAAALPTLPGWLRYVLTCSLCLSFWILAALSLFTGWTPLLLVAPPCTLMWDLAYRKLKGSPQ